MLVSGTLEWKDAIAGVALIVSAVNAWLTFFRRGRLRGSFGETMLVRMNEDGRLVFNPEITFYNPGSTLAITKQIDFELVNLSDDSREPLVWTQNVTTVFVEEARIKDTRFESYPSNIFISGRQAVGRRVYLETRRPLVISSGDYDIVSRVESDGTLVETTETIVRIRFVQKDIDFLARNKSVPRGHLTPNLLMFFQRGKNTNCYLTSPGFNYSVAPFPSKSSTVDGRPLGELQP